MSPFQLWLPSLNLIESITKFINSVTELVKGLIEDLVVIHDWYLLLRRLRHLWSQNFWFVWIGHGNVLSVRSLLQNPIIEHLLYMILNLIRMSNFLLHSEDLLLHLVELCQLSSHFLLLSCLLSLFFFNLNLTSSSLCTLFEQIVGNTLGAYTQVDIGLKIIHVK